MSLKKPNIGEGVRYVLVGAATTALSVFSYWLCYTPLAIPNVPSTVISWVLAVAFAFFANKVFVFQSRSFKGGTLLKEGVSFFGARIATGVLEVALMYLLVDLLNFNGTAMKLAVNLVVIVLNYVLSKLFIFNKK